MKVKYLLYGVLITMLFIVTLLIYYSGLNLSIPVTDKPTDFSIDSIRREVEAELGLIGSHNIEADTKLLTEKLSDISTGTTRDRKNTEMPKSQNIVPPKHIPEKDSDKNKQITHVAHVEPIKAIPEKKLESPKVNEVLVSTIKKVKVPKLHVVTYASHGGRDDRFCRAVESAFHHDIELVILGWGVKWLGLSQKLYAAYHYAKSLPEDDIMVFVDAFDVMFTNTADYILSEFLKDPTNTLVFAAECGCWPHVMENGGAPCFNAYPKAPTPYRYLNSGSWIGYGKNAADMLLDIIKKAGKDFANANDQKLVADMFIAHQHSIKLDYYSKIFQSMHSTSSRPLPDCNPQKHMQFVNIEMDGKTVVSTHGGNSNASANMKYSFYNKLTNTYPAVFHFNGGGKAHHLNYESNTWYRKEQRASLTSKKLSREEVFRDLGNYDLTIIAETPNNKKTNINTNRNNNKNSPVNINEIADMQTTTRLMKFTELCGQYHSNLVKGKISP